MSSDQEDAVSKLVSAAMNLNTNFNLNTLNNSFASGLKIPFFPMTTPENARTSSNNENKNESTANETKILTPQSQNAQTSSNDSQNPSKIAQPLQNATVIPAKLHIQTAGIQASNKRGFSTFQNQGSASPMAEENQTPTKKMKVNPINTSTGGPIASANLLPNPILNNLNANSKNLPMSPTSLFQPLASPADFLNFFKNLQTNLNAIPKPVTPPNQTSTPTLFPQSPTTTKLTTNNNGNSLGVPTPTPKSTNAPTPSPTSNKAKQTVSPQTPSSCLLSFPVPNMTASSSFQLASNISNTGVNSQTKLPQPQITAANLLANPTLPAIPANPIFSQTLNSMFSSLAPSLKPLSTQKTANQAGPSIQSPVNSNPNALAAALQGSNFNMNMSMNMNLNTLANMNPFNNPALNPYALSQFLLNNAGFMPTGFPAMTNPPPQATSTQSHRASNHPSSSQIQNNIPPPPPEFPPNLAYLMDVTTKHLKGDWPKLLGSFEIEWNHENRPLTRTALQNFIKDEEINFKLYVPKEINGNNSNNNPYAHANWIYVSAGNKPSDCLGMISLKQKAPGAHKEKDYSFLIPLCQKGMVSLSLKIPPQVLEDTLKAMNENPTVTPLTLENTDLMVYIPRNSMTNDPTLDDTCGARNSSTPAVQAPPTPSPAPTTLLSPTPALNFSNFNPHLNNGSLTPTAAVTPTSPFPSNPMYMSFQTAPLQIPAPQAGETQVNEESAKIMKFTGMIPHFKNMFFAIEKARLKRRTRDMDSEMFDINEDDLSDEDEYMNEPIQQQSQNGNNENAPAKLDANGNELDPQLSLFYESITETLHSEEYENDDQEQKLVKVPARITVSLRPYQHLAMNWMVNREFQGLAAERRNKIRLRQESKKQETLKNNNSKEGTDGNEDKDENDEKDEMNDDTNDSSSTKQTSSGKPKGKSKGRPKNQNIIDKTPLHPIYEELLFEDDTPFYFNKLSGIITLKKVAAPPDPKGGILADEMGLGKTLEVISLIAANSPKPAKKLEFITLPDKNNQTGAANKQPGKKLVKSHATLVVTPLTIVDQWKSEIEKFTEPSMKVYVYQGTRRLREIEKLAAYDVIVTTYGTLSREYRDMERMQGLGGNPTDAKNFVFDGDDESVDFGEDDDDESNFSTTTSSSQTSSSSQSKKESSGSKKKQSQSSQGSASQASPATGSSQPLFEIFFHRIVLDEAHYIKNRQSKAAKAAVSVNSEFRWAVTGTPIQNHIDDLFSIFNFLHVQPHGEWNWWSKYIGKPYERKDPRAIEALQAIIKRLCIRRTKNKEIDGKKILELPKKDVKMEALDFFPAEEAFYKILYGFSKDKFDEFLKNNTVMNNYANVLEMLLHLRQVCGHPGLLLQSYLKKPLEQKAMVRQFLTKFLEENKPEVVNQVFPMLEEILANENKDIDFLKYLEYNWRNSAKINCLINYLNSPKLQDTKAVVFSQWTTMLDILEVALRKNKIQSVRLDGTMTRKDRDSSIQEFKNNPNKRVALISLKVGGLGLNLVWATHVFLMDPWWNPAVEEQAIDRVHRIGQHKDVTVIRLVIKGSVEERILKLQKSKTLIANSALDSSNIGVMTTNPTKDKAANGKNGPKTKKEMQNIRLQDLKNLFSDEWQNPEEDFTEQRSQDDQKRSERSNKKKGGSGFSSDDDDDAELPSEDDDDNQSEDEDDTERHSEEEFEDYS